MQNSINAMKASVGEKQSRIKELDELLRMVDYYKSGKPAADKLKSIRFEKSRQKYKSEHDDTLRTFYMAERKLKPYFKGGKIPITAWRRERERLEQALRLAKFNIDETQTVEFCGLPTPAGSLLCASLGMLWQQGMLALSSDGVLLVAVLTSLLLVSPIRMFALKFHGFGWRGNEVRYLFLLASIVLIIILRTYAIPVIIVLYIVVYTRRNRS